MLGVMYVIFYTSHMLTNITHILYALTNVLTETEALKLYECFGCIFCTNEQFFSTDQMNSTFALNAIN